MQPYAVSTWLDTRTTEVRILERENRETFQRNGRRVREGLTEDEWNRMEEVDMWRIRRHESVLDAVEREVVGQEIVLEEVFGTICLMGDLGSCTGDLLGENGGVAA